MMKENLAKIGDLGCAKVIEEEKPQSEKASEDVAEQKNEKVITPVKEDKNNKLKDIDMMPVDESIDKLSDKLELDVGNPFDIIDDEEDFLLTEGDMNLLEVDQSPMPRSSKKIGLLDSAVK